MSALPKEKEQNKGGRPVGSYTKISKLQRISTKLNSMANNDAIPMLEKSLAGEVVDKESLATAKFVVNAAKQYHQAIVAEKSATKENTTTVDEDDDDDDSGPAKFSLRIVPS